MANFKVGDRVRVIDGRGRERRVIGLCGTVVRNCLTVYPTPLYEVTMDLAVDGEVSWLWRSHELAPLTPPAADAWAADAVRKVTKPQHVEPEVAERLREFDRLIGN